MTCDETTVLSVLLVGRRATDATRILKALQRGGFEVEHLRVGSAADLAVAMGSRGWDLAVVDCALPRLTALEALRSIREHDLSIPVVMVCSRDNQTVAVDGMHAGAVDYVIKSDMTRLPAAVRRELAAARERRARTAAEEVLRDSEGRYRALVEDQTDLVVRWLPLGAMVLVNEAFCGFLGRPRSELVGENFIEFIPDAHRRQFLESVAALAAERPVAHAESGVRRPDGTLVWHEWSSRGTFDGTGRLTQVLSVGRDVTERRRALDVEQQEFVLVEVLRDTAAALNSTLNLDEVLDRILANVGWVIPHDASAILEVEGARVRILRWRGWEERGMSDLRRDQLFAEEECRVFTEMVLGGDSIAIQDTTATQWWEPDSRGMNWVRSLAAAPLFDEGRVRGALILFSSRRDYFTPMHMELLEGFASQAATATRNARLFGMVSRSRAELRRLSAQVISAQEEQRRRISRELHDEVGQALTGIVIHATVLESSLADRKDTTMFVDRARDVAALARHTLEQIRGLSHLLRPTILDDLGVGPAVRWFAERFSSRSGLAVEVDVGSLGDTRFEQAVETTLYRAVQEALTNVARHAHATRARVKIDGAPDGVLLRVEDDGCGFESDGALSSQTHDSGLGLLGMRERVIGLGGQLEIGSQPGVGTTIVVRLPVVPEMR